jgi:xanthine dehydrogenase molybdenum-binding subunit
MALLEDTDYDPKTGRLTNRGLLTDYKMLGAVDLPDPENFETFFAHTYEPTGPMGAKGIGEAALNPVPAAVAAAIYNATGLWFTELPILPEDILRAFRERSAREGNKGPGKPQVSFGRIGRKGANHVEYPCNQS